MITIDNLEFAYSDKGFRLSVDRFAVESGAQVAVIGPSGSGKTTLLHLIAGILAPSSGRIAVDGCDMAALSDSRRRDFRIANIGLVFQEFELLEYLTVRENILLPFRINSTFALTAEAGARADRLIQELQLDDIRDRRPGQLSQGERQRVAIGRALVTQPKIILADEPTGNLDPVIKERVLDLLLEQAARRQVTTLMVTHDHALLDRFERVVDVGDFHGRDIVLPAEAAAVSLSSAPAAQGATGDEG